MYLSNKYITNSIFSQINTFYKTYLKIYSLNNNTHKKMAKVHGSLNRAGKVKGATPKVECSEHKARRNKLNRRGRAKKRRLYEKHFNRLYNIE
jgi:small subunit ribosomal protein S30e